ncbi:putative mediator of RNA polymerase II transcription subunit 26 [Athalia rosae]|uniref:putative mediator of RNA polymerase II transcription subunit 26 n=1 Tax=Athalia rosae TaxID=37344 RepID=UPI002033772C|nr:putative mediator of RNA polymerase II transcription subunit 26 [Athalia rosae]
MSPTSQGALEVERYIGSCLISSNARPAIHKSVKKQEQQIARGKPRYPQTYGTTNGNDQCQVQYVAPAGWQGAPLISMTSSPRRNNHRSSPAPIQQQQQQQQQHQQSQQQQQQEQQQLQLQVQQQQQQHLVGDTDQGNIHQRSPLSRLAIHTQGAPLILSGRFHARGKIHNGNAGNANNNGNNNPNNNNNNNNINNSIGNGNNSVVAGGVGNTSLGNGSRYLPPKFQRSVPGDQLKKGSNLKEVQTGKDINGGNVASIDSLSVASDESSGSNNSENSLPRIIKPRKRRKKDRKPPNVTTEISKSEELTCNTVSETSSIVTLKPYVPVCYERFEPHRTPSSGGQRRLPSSTRESYSSGRPHLTQEIVDTRQRYHRHLFKVLDNNRNVVALPPSRIQQNNVDSRLYRNSGHQLVHVVADGSNEATTRCEDGVFEGPGSCQCRYCDPSGLIWDVDQNGYSPYLTPPMNDFASSQFPRVPLFFPQGLPSQEKSVEYFEEPPATVSNSFYLERENAALRRSWSDPTSFFSDEITTPNRSVGVIGDRAPVETGRGKRPTSWRSWSSPGTNSTTSGTSQGLEVSTEIVTSPNGHRDLEIKFYSSSPPTANQEDEKSDFGFPDNEDFSDIWSYHESKLQQDLRTLLQAEE